MINKVAILEFGTNADPIHCLKGKAGELSKGLKDSITEPSELKLESCNAQYHFLTFQFK